MAYGRVVETWRNPVVVKRTAALAAGLVVAVGLVGGCTQKPGVAATLTPVSCKDKDVTPVRAVAATGAVSWTCDGGGPVVRGKTVSISSAEVADVVQGLSLSGPQAVQALIDARTVLRVADGLGVTVSDDDAAKLLDTSGIKKSDGMMVLARSEVLTSSEQAQAVNAATSSARASLDIVVNPRFGTFDPTTDVAVATLTPLSCQKEGVVPVNTPAFDGTTSWSCDGGPVVRGQSASISVAEVIDVATGTGSGTNDAVQLLIDAKTVLRVADGLGATVSDNEAAQLLATSGVEKSDGMMVVAKASILTSTSEQAAVISADAAAAQASLDIVDNPRLVALYGMSVLVAPAWATS